MLLEPSDPTYQADLTVFLWNSGIRRVERVGDASVRISDEEVDDARLRSIVDLWQRTHPSVHVQIS